MRMRTRLHAVRTARRRSRIGAEAAQGGLEPAPRPPQEHEGGWYEHWYVFEICILAYFRAFSRMFTYFARFANFACFRAICATTCKNCANTCNICAKAYKTCAKTCKIRENTRQSAKIRDNHGFWRIFPPDFRANSKTYKFSYHPSFKGRQAGNF